MTRCDKKDSSLLFTVLSVAIIIIAWWILAETRFKQTGIIPSPLKTVEIIRDEVQKDSFSKAVLSTLQRSFISFLISFAAASVLALLAYYRKFVDKLLNPFIILCRSMPTMALILILLLTVGSAMLPIVVAFLVVFPLCYENMRTAISDVDKKLIAMAKVFKVPLKRQLAGIYFPRSSLVLDLI